MNDDDRNCDCDGFANAIWGPIALVALIVHPFLSITILILWAVATAWPDRSRPPRPAPPPPLPSSDLTFGGLIWKFAALYAAVAVAIFAVWISTWLLAGLVLAFVVWWTKFRRRPDPQEVAP